ncbi:MAG TPA: 4a-hydroxytetrahydrobiopterin dehydratase [Thermoanaerobaculia bacterium]|jgi:pterin-4a-carbinolamine dehydratase|nr:4a-hydroxytetrahydrobiopterin dehydratase [Thermoanaerobaculia bacterium]
MNPDTVAQTKSQSVKQRLKAERVQEMLLAMPAWRLLPGGKAIDRAFQFPASNVAAAWATFVAAFAAELGHPVTLDIAQEQVVLTLAAPKVRGRQGELTESILEFAQRLG